MKTFAYLGRLAAGLFLCVALAGSANAAVRYEFAFFDLGHNIPEIDLTDFGLVLEAPDYITVSGVNPLVGDPLPTSLGYDVLNVGTNKFGWFLFSNVGGFVGEAGAVFSPTTFLFRPTAFVPDFIRAPGVYEGAVQGSAAGLFHGGARLTVTDTLAVPEPGTWAIMVLGLGGAGMMLRRRGVIARRYTA